MSQYRQMRNIFWLFSILLAALFSYPGHARRPTPKQALLYWELYANPDIKDPNFMSELYNDSNIARVRQIPRPDVTHIKYYLFPRDKMLWLQSLELPEELKRLVAPVIVKGRECIPIAIHPYGKNFSLDELFRTYGVEISKGQYENLSFDPTASRGVMLKDPRSDTGGASPNDMYTQMKASTEVTYGRNPDKIFDAHLAERHAFVHKLIARKQFYYSYIVPEPLFLVIPSQSVFLKGFGVGFRDWRELLTGEPKRYVMPMFTATRAKEGYLLALINGYLNPTDFALRHIAYPFGLADREYGEKTGVRLESHHGQNRLLLLDTELRPVGVGSRDVGDTLQFNRRIILQQFGPSTVNDIDDKFPNMLSDEPYRFRFPYIKNENPWSNDQTEKQMILAYGAGLESYPNSGENKIIFDPSDLSGSMHNFFRLSEFEKTEKPVMSEKINFVKPLTDVPADLAPLWQEIRELLVADIFGQTLDQNQIQAVFRKAEPFLERLRQAQGTFDELIAESLVYLGHKDKWSVVLH